MRPLNCKNNRYYMEGNEVLVYPIKSIEVHHQYQGRIGPIKNIIGELIEDSGKLGKNLQKANSYLCSSGIEVILVPEEKVKDGRISEVRVRNFTINFYKAIPAIPENKEKLENIFGLRQDVLNQKNHVPPPLLGGGL